MYSLNMNDLYRVTADLSWNLGLKQSHPKDILKVKVIDKQRARVLGTNSILDSNVIPNIYLQETGMLMYLSLTLPTKSDNTGKHFLEVHHVKFEIS